MERRNLKVTPSAPMLSDNYDNTKSTAKTNSNDLKLELSNARKITPTAPMLTPDDIKIPAKLYPLIENDLKMEHPNLEKMSSTAPMLPDDDNVSLKLPAKLNCGGKILIREDTVLTNLNGCAGCGRGQFTCTSVKKSWSVLCWGRHSEKKYYCCKYTYLHLYI